MTDHLKFVGGSVDLNGKSVSTARASRKDSVAQAAGHSSISPCLAGYRVGQATLMRGIVTLNGSALSANTYILPRQGLDFPVIPDGDLAGFQGQMVFRISASLAPPLASCLRLIKSMSHR